MSEKINLQNLGGRGRGSANHPLIGQVRNLLIAPDGYRLTICDSAQIEARVLAWLAGQDDLLQDFREGKSPYCSLATELFGEKVWKPTDEEKKTPEGKTMAIRYGFGKDGILGCIAFGTPILTQNGWKSIENLKLTDKIWDGSQWVDHAGIVDKGSRVCVNVNGVWLTPDHAVVNNRKWCLAVHLATNNQVLGICTENLQLLKLNLESEVGLSPSNAVAPVVESLLHQEIIWSPENLHAVMSVLKVPLAELSRCAPNFWETPTMNKWLTEFVACLKDVMTSGAEHGVAMVDEVLKYGPVGSTIEQLLLDTLCPYLDTTDPNLKSTVLTTIKDTNQAIYDLQHGLNRCGTRHLTTPKESGQVRYAVGAAVCSQGGDRHNNIVANTVRAMLPTYDILMAGPRKRFQAGDLLSENCGYGMGTLKFYTNCRENEKLRPLFDSGEYDWDFIDGLIKTYRKKYSKIPALWQSIEKAFRFVCKYPNEKRYYHNLYNPGYGGPLLSFWKSGATVNIRLPSGRVLYYHHAKVNRKGDISYDHGKLWGGSLVENIVQAISRDLLGYWILECEKSLPVILHCHDEVVCCSLASIAESDLEIITKKMSKGPAWAEGLPLAAEGQISRCYVK